MYNSNYEPYTYRAMLYTMDKTPSSADVRHNASKALFMYQNAALKYQCQYLYLVIQTQPFSLPLPA